MEQLSEQPAIAVDLFCPSCAYNLRGLTGSRCPECGESIDDLRDPVSRIPWVHRKKLGWWLAYWKTVHFVMFKQKHLANELARPVSYRDAQLFRSVTVLFSFVPMLVVGWILVACETRAPIDHDLFLVLWEDSRLGACWYLGMGLFLAGATGIPGYFFHPRRLRIETQNRAIALSYYTCSPLAFGFVSAVPIVAWAVLQPFARHGPLGPLGLAVGLLVPVCQVAGWWVIVIGLARRVHAQELTSAVSAIVLVPLCWLIFWLVASLGVPVLLVLVLVIIRSLA